MLVQYFKALITFSQTWCTWNPCLDFSCFILMTNSSLNTGRGQSIDLGPYKTQSKLRCYSAEKPSSEASDWTPRNCLCEPHQHPNLCDASRGAWRWGFWWPCHPGGLSTATSAGMPVTRAAIHPHKALSVPDLLLSPTPFKQNLSYSFSSSLPWFSACYPCYVSACAFRPYTLFMDIFL